MNQEPQVLQRAMPHSIEVSRNARGEYSYSAKVYFDLDQLERTYETLEAISDWFIIAFLPPASEAKTP